MQNHNAIEQLASLLISSQHAVAFTGAGLSTESGIPDFRSPGGLWERYQPIDFNDFIQSPAKRKEAWRRKLATEAVMAKASPNAGHQGLAELLKRGLLRGIITQNVDGLHQAAGAATDKVVELHGNATYAVCLDCQRRFELAPILQRFRDDESLPVCDDCGGIVKTATISFGQAMPEAAMARADALSQSADLMVVLGSSLSVYPAAAFPEQAKYRGAKLAIINRDPTSLDEQADVLINAEIGPTVSAILDQL